MAEKKTTARKREADLLATKTKGEKKQTAQKPAPKKTESAKKPESSVKKAEPAKKTASSAKKTETTAKKTSTAKKTAVAKNETGAKKTTKTKKTQVVAANPVAEAAVRRSERAAIQRRTAPKRPVEDDYDRFLKSEQPAVRKKKPKKKRKKGHLSVTFLLLLLIGSGLVLLYRQNIRYNAFAEMKNAVNQQTFYAGTTVEGIDVSNMTLEQALEYWQTNIEPTYANRTVTLSNGESYTAQAFGYQSDYQTVLSNAYSAGRSGSLVERYQALSTRVGAPADYTITRKLYDETLIAAYVSSLSASIDTPAQNAKIESFNLEAYSFEFSDSSDGQQLDAESLKTDIESALNNGGGSVEVKVETVPASVTKDEISSEYGMIAYAVTNASSSSSNRLSNIKLALSLINGTCLQPGETFSFNDTVGKRTKERGFKVATAYSGGSVTEDVGGGICQVSTTLFNAAVKADLQIDERHNHSLTVAYVDKGKDAAVNWGSQDLKFTNTSDDVVYIVCVLSDDKRVRIGICGHLLENGETIEVEAETTGTINYDTVYQANALLPTGTTRVTQNGKNGYTAVAYKVRKDANGNTISRDLLCKSSYKATDEIIEYGP